MRTLIVPADQAPTTRGEIHGESFRYEIASLAELRLHLTQQRGGFSTTDEILALARQHLPVLAAFDAALHAELMGIARGAAIEPEHVIVLNHYTDLRDIQPKSSADASDLEDDCSVVYARTDAGALVAQTWDMHASAMPYVMMLGVPACDDRPAAWLLSLTGCLGMAGLSAGGVAVAINNLHSRDARVGIVWPALVRRALCEPSAASARDVIGRAPLGSGHHYLVADRDAAFGVETSGTKQTVLFHGDAPSYVHTNHCLDPELAACSHVAGGSTTHDRYDWLAESVAQRPIADMADAWSRLGSVEGYPRSVCTNMATPHNPHAPATCGAIAMKMDAGTVWAAAGLTHNVKPEIFSVADL